MTPSRPEPIDGEKHTEHYCCYEDSIPHGQGVYHECHELKREEPRTIKKGRIFNHRDGMSELERFQMEQKPEPMTAEERALKLSCKWGNGAPGSAQYVETVKTIQESMDEAREETKKKYTTIINHVAKERPNSGECIHARNLEKLLNDNRNRYFEGFSDCRERAAQEVGKWISGEEDYTDEVLAKSIKRIRALRAEGEKDTTPSEGGTK